MPKGGDRHFIMETVKSWRSCYELWLHVYGWFMSEWYSSLAPLFHIMLQICGWQLLCRFLLWCYQSLTRFHMTTIKQEHIFPSRTKMHTLSHCSILWVSNQNGKTPLKGGNRAPAVLQQKELTMTDMCSRCMCSCRTWAGSRAVGCVVWGITSDSAMDTWKYSVPFSNHCCFQWTWEISSPVPDISAENKRRAKMIGSVNYRE